MLYLCDDDDVLFLSMKSFLFLRIYDVTDVANEKGKRRKGEEQ